MITFIIKNPGQQNNDIVDNDDNSFNTIIMSFNHLPLNNMCVTAILWYFVAIATFNIFLNLNRE